MDRYDELIVEKMTRVSICRHIEKFIKSRLEDIERYKTPLVEGDIYFDGVDLEAEIEEMELEIKTARLVIDEIMSKVDKITTELMEMDNDVR